MPSPEGIGVALNHSKKKIIELVKQHLTVTGAAVAGGSTATRVRSFKLHKDQAENVNAAIEKRRSAARRLTAHDVLRT